MDRLGFFRGFGGILKLPRSLINAKPFVGRGTSSESRGGLLSEVTSPLRPHLFGVSGVKSGGGLASLSDCLACCSRSKASGPML